RKNESAIVEQNARQRIEAFVRPRQRAQDCEIPEEEMQQQRDVAHYLDIGGGELRDQPVVRKAQNADEKTKQCGEDDTDDGDDQRIEQPDEKGPGIARLLAIGDQRLDDAEARRIVEKAKARGNVEAFEIFLRRCGEEPDRYDDGD